MLWQAFRRHGKAYLHMTEGTSPQEKTMYTISEDAPPLRCRLKSGHSSGLCISCTLELSAVCIVATMAHVKARFSINMDC